MKWILLGILLALNLAVQGEQSIDSLLSDADRVRSSKFDEFSSVLSKLDARKSEFSVEQGHYFNFLNSYKLAYQGRHKKARQSYLSVIDQSSDPTLVFRARISLVNLLVLLRLDVEGLKELELALSSLESVSDRDVRHQGMVIASVAYNRVEQHDLAMSYSTRLINDSPNDRNLCGGYQTLAEASYYSGKLSLDSDIFTEGLTTCERLDEILIANFIRVYQARLMIDSGEMSPALEILEGNLPAVEATKYPRLMSEFYAALAAIYCDLGRALECEENAIAAIDVSRDFEYSRTVAKAYELLSDISSRRGDFRNAVEYHKRYAAADKAHINDVTAKQLAYQLGVLQAEEQKREIQLLNNQNEVLRLEQALAKKATQNTRLVIILLALLTMFIIAWALRMRYNQNRFRRISQMDDLTGVNNRHHFFELSNDALMQGKRMDKECSLILLDMDHFKLINDNYGHPAGDKVLKHVMKICSEYARNNDIIGRLGGEEFAVLLPGCDMEKARYIAEQYRRKIAESDFSEQGYDFTISASLGVSSTRNSGYELKRLISDADVMMYAAKQRGRNQVAVMTEVLAADGAS